MSGKKHVTRKGKQGGEREKTTVGCHAKRSWPGTSERRPDEMRAHATHLWGKSKGNKTSKNVRLGPQQVQRSCGKRA